MTLPQFATHVRVHFRIDGRVRLSIWFPRLCASDVDELFRRARLSSKVHYAADDELSDALRDLGSEWSYCDDGGGVTIYEHLPKVLWFDLEARGCQT